MLSRLMQLSRVGQSNVTRRFLSSQLTDLTGSRSTTPDESLDTKRARLLYQSTKRGILECDILLGGFCREYLKSLTPTQVDTYDRLVNGGLNEWDIYYWITETKPTPADYETDVMGMLRKYALETKKHYYHKAEKL